MLILASASQSRKKLLENCQIEFIQIASKFDETTIQEKNMKKAHSVPLLVGSFLYQPQEKPHSRQRTQA